jgi:DNA-binding SARP family transcriptional activator
LQVWQGRRQVEAPALSQRRAGELLALLLVSPGQRLGLEAAAERLWPERPPETAQDLLHKASSALRRALEPELPNRFPSRYLLVQDGMAQLLSLWAQDLSAWVDFAAFEAACRRGDWDAALVLYRGNFMPECAYAEWSTTPRQHYATLYQEALLEAGRLRFAAGSFAAALEACRRLLALEPWQEQAALLGMRAALELGDRAAARRLYQALEKSLRDEVGVAPQSELQALFRSL